MPNRNAHSTPAAPPKVEATGHQKNPKAHTVDVDNKSPKVPGYGMGKTQK